MNLTEYQVNKALQFIENMNYVDSDILCDIWFKALTGSFTHDQYVQFSNLLYRKYGRDKMQMVENIKFELTNLNNN